MRPGANSPVASFSPILTRETLQSPLHRNGNGGTAGSNGASLSWLSPDEKTREPFTTDPAAAWQLAQDYDLCITGEAIHVIGSCICFQCMHGMPS